jgi:hypothetical protein
MLSGMLLLVMETNKAATKKTDRMYLTAAEAEKMNLPSADEQIRRWNELQKQIRGGK